jgi:hypothetical protein
MTCPICGQSPCKFDNPLDDPEVHAKMWRNHLFALRSIERAIKGKAFQTEEEERDADHPGFPS